jgi:hypothetical protein
VRIEHECTVLPTFQFHSCSLSLVPGLFPFAITSIEVVIDSQSDTLITSASGYRSRKARGVLRGSFLSVGKATFDQIQAFVVHHV